MEGNDFMAKFSSYGFSQKDKEIICSDYMHSLAIRIKNHYLVWDTEDFHCYQIDSLQFAHLRDRVDKYCSTLEDFLVKVPSHSSFIKTALTDDFLSKVFEPNGEKLSMQYRFKYPVDDPSTTVEIYCYSEEYIEKYNNWYIVIDHKDGYMFFEITPDNKISCMTPYNYVYFHSNYLITESIEVLPDKCKELLKSFIDSGAYKYMHHPHVYLNNYKPKSYLPKVMPKQEDKTNLFG